jgi:hypothetical protein
LLFPPFSCQSRMRFGPGGCLIAQESFDKSAIL